MKCKVGVFKVTHETDMEIEAENQVEATRKAMELLDTENRNYLLVVEQERSIEDIFTQRILQNASSLCYLGYPGPGGCHGK